MKHSMTRALLMFISLTIPIPMIAESNETDSFQGIWEGECRFYNTDFNADVGVLPVKLEITDAYRIQGMVGGAIMLDAELTEDSWNNGYMIRAKLEGKIFPGHSFHKKRLVLLLKVPEGERIQGDLHLKNNFVFDLTMRPGGLELQRIDP